MNHTSDQHPWFQAARAARRRVGAKRDYYVWSDDPSKYARHAHHLHRHGVVQLGVGPGRAAALLAPLLQPPARPQLRQPARAARRSAHHALLARHGRRRLPPGRDPLPRRARGHVSNENHARDARHRSSRSAPTWTRTTRASMLLAEANMWPEDVRQYFGDGDECHMAYHFPLMPRLYMSIAMEDRHPAGRDHVADAATSPPTASGRSSCATTTSSRSRW